MTETSEKSPGYLHPINAMIQDMIRIFTEIGFEIADAPLLDTEWYNFDAVNVMPGHPARDMQDTFWIKDHPGKVLRTHTSNTQVRFMEKNEPPFKVIVPGLCFRNEATDATHEAQFHQIEAVVVGPNVSLSQLKWTIAHFLKKIFGDDVEYRLRPGYFPFVEPGVEVDLKFRGKWMELLGAGMIHPNVLRNGGIDPEKFSGFALGMGIERLAMMRYNIPDIRTFYKGDLRLHHALYEK